MYSYNHKIDLAEYAKSQRLKPNPLDEENPTRSNSAQNLMSLGMNYRFRLRDLPKYSQTLRLTGNNLKYSALGKLIPNPRERKKILIKGSHFNTLLKLLRATDWSQTPVYHQFLRNRRWKHEDESVYSEIELRYNISYINKLRNVENINNMNKADIIQII